MHSVTAWLFPMAMKGTFKKYLLKKFHRVDVEILIRLSGKEFKSILKRAPDVGGNENLFITNYYIGAYLIALYKNIRDKLSIDDFNRMIADVLHDSAVIKTKMKNQDLLSLKFKNRMINAGIWCEKNKDIYPTNWLVSVEDEMNPELTHLIFTRCGLDGLCKSEDVLEFLPSLCAIDYITMSFAKCNLERPSTIGNGDGYCNFYITPNTKLY